MYDPNICRILVIQFSIDCVESDGFIVVLYLMLIMASANIAGAGDTEGVSDEHTTGETINELIYFVQQKFSVLAADDLVSICSKFHTSDEIRKTQRTLQKYVKERLTRHSGADKDTKTVYDITKLCLDPSVKLPTFVPMHLERLPPVDVEHVDVSAILQELTFIRSEIK